MATIFTILLILVCVLMVLIVLIQNPKGGGINSGLSGASQMLGVKQQTDLVEKWTWYLAVGLVVLCLISTPILHGNSSGEEQKSIETEVPVQGIPQGGINTAPGVK